MAILPPACDFALLKSVLGDARDMSDKHHLNPERKDRRGPHQATTEQGHYVVFASALSCMACFCMFLDQTGNSKAPSNDS